MGQPEKLWAFTLGLASLPADAMLLSVLSDSRLAQRAAVLAESFLEDVTSLSWRCSMSAFGMSWQACLKNQSVP
eukprot:734262-Amphidinium_carterae.1